MATTEIDQATKLGHDLVAYIESEQSDLKATDNKFDALWQSIYDVCKLVHLDILDELLSEEEYRDGVAWLKKYQHLTEDYKNIELEL